MYLLNHNLDFEVKVNLPSILTSSFIQFPDMQDFQQHVPVLGDLLIPYRIKAPVTNGFNSYVANYT